MISFEAIMRDIESLESSTNLTVELKNETVVCTGLNSPYKSHQKIDYVLKGHNQERIIYIKNGYHSVVIFDEWCYDRYQLHFKGSWHIFNGRSFILNGILERIPYFYKLFPDWILEGSREVIVATEDYFRYYDDEGHPVYWQDDENSLDWEWAIKYRGKKIYPFEEYDKIELEEEEE